ncbi:unnamed protein product, partial [Lymnaea stagnalis]
MVSFTSVLLSSVSSCLLFGDDFFLTSFFFTADLPPFTAPLVFAVAFFLAFILALGLRLGGTNFFLTPFELVPGFGGQDFLMLFLGCRVTGFSSDNFLALFLGGRETGFSSDNFLALLLEGRGTGLSSENFLTLFLGGRGTGFSSDNFLDVIFFRFGGDTAISSSSLSSVTFSICATFLVMPFFLLPLAVLSLSSLASKLATTGGEPFTDFMIGRFLFKEFRAPFLFFWSSVVSELSSLTLGFLSGLGLLPVVSALTSLLPFSGLSLLLMVASTFSSYSTTSVLINFFLLGFFALNFLSAFSFFSSSFLS